MSGTIIPTRTIARAVKRLEDTGYVRKITDPGNRRAVRLFPTGKRERVTPVLQAIDSGRKDRVCSGLKPDEREILNSPVRMVAENSHRN